MELMAWIFRITPNALNLCTMQEMPDENAHIVQCMEYKYIKVNQNIIK